MISSTLFMSLLLVSEPSANESCLKPSGLQIERLRTCARHGDKVAQYELARRLELGDGVPSNLFEARRWYCKAASATKKSNPVYSPAVGSEKAGRIYFGPPSLSQANSDAVNRVRELGLACRR